MERTWIVVTTHSADQFAKLLFPHMFNTDNLLVVKLQKEYQGWLPTKSWEWLNDKYF